MTRICVLTSHHSSLITRKGKELFLLSLTVRREGMKEQFKVFESTRTDIRIFFSRKKGSNITVLWDWTLFYHLRASLTLTVYLPLPVPFLFALSLSYILSLLQRGDISFAKDLFCQKNFCQSSFPKKKSVGWLVVLFPHIFLSVDTRHRMMGYQVCAMFGAICSMYTQKEKYEETVKIGRIKCWSIFCSTQTQHIDKGTRYTHTWQCTMCMLFVKTTSSLFQNSRG